MNELIRWQKELDNAIVEKSNVKPTRKDLATALLVEASELLEVCGYRWWKNEILDEEAIKEESIDILHFLLSFFNKMGMDADEVKRLYSKKRNVNFNRLAKQEFKAEVVSLFALRGEQK